VIYVCVTDLAMLTHAKRTFSSRYDRSSLLVLDPARYSRP
jgi:hypothetical protein